MLVPVLSSLGSREEADTVSRAVLCGWALAMTALIEPPSLDAE